MLDVTVIGFSGGLQALDTENTSLIISDGLTSLLVDASGSPVNALLRNGYDPLTIDALVLTHAHVDHLYALPSLLHNLWLMKRTKPLVIMGNAPTIEKARELYRLFRLDQKKMMEIHWVSDACRIGMIDIKTFPVFHRPKVPTNGYVFAGGGVHVSYFPDSAVTLPYPECASGSDLIIHEAGGLDNDREALREQGHSSGLQAAMLARDLDAKKLLLVHLPGDKQKREDILKEALSVFPDTELAQSNHGYIIGA